LLRGDRKRLHALVGQTLEELERAGQSDLAALLAHHFQLAGDTARALHYFTHAANRALAIYSNTEAAADYAAALALVSVPEARARLLAGRGDAQARQGYFLRAITDYRAAIGIYAALSDTAGLARTYGRLAQTTYDSGDVRAALAVCHEALAAVQNHVESVDDVPLLTAIARIYYYNGLAAEARASGHRLLALAQRLGHPEGEIQALFVLGTLRDESLAVAAARLATAGALAQTAGLLPSAGSALHNQAVVLWELGDLPAAYACIRRSIAVYREGGLTGSELHALGTLIYTAVWMGDFAATIEPLARIRLLAARFEPRNLAALVLERIEGTVAGYLGEYDTADTLLQAAITNGQRTGNLQVILTATRDLTRLLGEQGRWERARPLLLNVVPLTDRQLLFDRVWARARLSETEAALGDLAQARQWLAEARLAAATPPTRPEAEALALATARLAAAEGRRAEALAAYAEAAAVQAAMGTRRHRAVTLRAWAAVQTAGGTPADRAAARALLAEARALCVAMELAHEVAAVDAARTLSGLAS
ncbi:MAG TPA: hypothetical protein VKY74_23125, partial [Chloroflexia bacterium]|nr:hypothetical protein [Chloroflexia bacterium]